MLRPTPAERRRPKMARKHQYWVVSPNVKNHEKTVADWKRVILHTRAAIMGWPPDDRRHRIGPKFANDVELGDIILIARRHHSEPDVVGFGAVKGECRERRFRVSDEPVYVRKLEPFITVQHELEGPLRDVLPINRAMVQLHPDDKEKYTHREVCEWMARQLGLTDRQSDSDSITERDLRKSKTETYDYKVRTKKQVTEARKREENLLDDYYQWLKKQGRHLSRLRYGRPECDAWEGERQNLIEAKGSISREDIRMAVGQLLDYAFQMREKFENPNKAILLPEEPPQDAVKWLEPLGIKVIWRSGQSFVDNVDGQFI
jgi:hypothetical protein